MANNSWLGTDDEWPQHSRPAAQAALKRAKRAGFMLRQGPHWWLKCPSAPPDEPCLESIYSTAGDKGGTQTAKFVDDLMRKCPHRAQAPPVHVEPLDALDLYGQLDVISPLIQAYVRLKDADGLQREAEELEATHGSSDDAIVAEIIDRLAEADGLRAEAGAEAYRNREWDFFPPGAESVREAALEQLAPVQQTVMRARMDGSIPLADLDRISARVDRYLSDLGDPNP